MHAVPEDCELPASCGQRDLRAPFPYFGGKSAVADVVWRAIGADVKNYVEPFAGSLAVLLARPGGAGHTETVNDADGLLANFWRALASAPDAVAGHADWPVNEVDLHARHLWLVGERERITERLMGDPEWFDAKAAGWWVWGLCCWIGRGWCSGNGLWMSVNGVLTRAEGENGVVRQLPHLGSAGQGVSRRRPHLFRGEGINRSHGGGERSAWLRGYMRGLAYRLHRVRVCCGDWSRVTGPSVTHRHGPTGVFLDPPYADTAGRDKNIYTIDCLRVAHVVREWAIAEGENPLMRIVLAGYEGEHDMPPSWRVHAWKTRGGMANLSDDETRGKENRGKERLWFSPHCLTPESESTLFSE